MCKWIYRFSLPLILLAALIVLPASEARAAPDTECRGTIGAVVVEGKLVVPEGETCVLVGTTVHVSIMVRPGATLIANGIEVLTPGTVNIQADGAERIEVTGLRKPDVVDPEELQPSEVLGSIQAVGGGTVIIADTSIGGAVQILDNSDSVRITESFVEGAVQLGKNKGGVSVEASFLGEGVEVSETVGDVTFSGITSDQSDLTIGKTEGNVIVRNNPSLGENFEVSETSGHVAVLDNVINDNAEIFAALNGATVSGNSVGDNVEILEAGGEVTFAANVVEGAAFIDKTTGRVTADDNSIGFQPPVPGEPEVVSGGSLLVSEASEGAIVRDNTVTGYLDVTENLIATTVSNNMVRVGITVAKNVGAATEVSLNRAGGDIECKDNNPPATGAGNVAGADGGSGSLKGECAPPL